MQNATGAFGLSVETTPSKRHSSKRLHWSPPFTRPYGRELSLSAIEQHVPFRKESVGILERSALSLSEDHIPRANPVAATR